MEQKKASIHCKTRKQGKKAFLSEIYTLTAFRNNNIHVIREILAFESLWNASAGDRQRAKM